MFSSYLIWTLLSFQVCCAIDACFVVQPSPSPKSNPLPVPPRPALLGSIPSLRHSASSTIARDFNYPIRLSIQIFSYANFTWPLCENSCLSLIDKASIEVLPQVIYYCRISYLYTWYMLLFWSTALSPYLPVGWCRVAEECSQADTWVRINSS